MTESSEIKYQTNLFDASFATPFLLRHQGLWHVLFWLSIYMYEGLVWGMLDGEYSQHFVSSAIELPIKIAATYFTLFILIDKFLMNRKYGAFVTLLVASMIVFGVLQRIVVFNTIYPMFYPEATNAPLFLIPKILITIFSVYSLVAIVASFHLIKHWYAHQQATQALKQTAHQLEKEKISAELKVLKSQINPHFLFNTLNNLYALTLNHSARAPEVVHKLSQLMSYMLYDSNQPEVPLDDEIRHIKNYIGLEKIRYGDRLDVSLNIYDDVTDVTIAPLLLLPFVENSFKHGASNQLAGGWIRMDVSVQHKWLVVKVDNSKSSEHPKNNHRNGGLGLQNVKKRLELIYPNKYVLHMMDENDTFLVVLRIKLPSLEKEGVKRKEKKSLVDTW